MRTFKVASIHVWLSAAAATAAAAAAVVDPLCGKKASRSGSTKVPKSSGAFDSHPVPRSNAVVYLLHGTDTIELAIVSMLS
jgi:hypothetical protein